MEIEVEHVTYVGAGPLKGAHLSDHGQDGGKGAIGCVERDVQHRARVDDLVDGLEGIAGWTALPIGHIGVHVNKCKPRSFRRFTVLNGCFGYSSSWRGIVSFQSEI